MNKYTVRLGILIVVAVSIGCSRSAQQADQKSREETTSENVAQVEVGDSKETKLSQEEQQPLFIIRENGFGEEAEWTFDFLNKVHQQLVTMMDNPDIEPPRGIQLTLVKEDVGALAGYAAPDHIKFVSDQWPREAQRIWILAHELTNLFAAHYGGAGGYPSDWWSNGRSPFPVYVAGVACEAVVEQEVADWIKNIDSDHSDQQLYWALHEKYGFKLFADFFELIRKDEIDLGFVGAHEYPAPDECRSAYTLAYLSIVAGENLAPIARDHGIGKKPNDWDERHAELGMFVEYSISNEEVERIIEKRKQLFDTIDQTTDVFSQRLVNYRLGKQWVGDK